MSSSAICPKFSQNAWRKDLCSNCFKSKEDHKPSNSKSVKTDTSSLVSKDNYTNITTSNSSSTTMTNKTAVNNNPIKKPTKSIMKFGIPNNSKIISTTTVSTTTIKKTIKVSFPKDLVQVIGYGGDWSDCDNSDDEDDYQANNTISNNNNHQNDENSVSDEEDLELIRLTKSNTDFNMNNGNLLGDATDNIKKSFAALRLGAPQLDAEGKKQTLKICVQPFGAATKMTSMKEKFEMSKMEYEKLSREKKLIKTGTTVTGASQTVTATSVQLVANKLQSISKNNKDNKELQNKKITASPFSTSNNTSTINTTTNQTTVINDIKDSLETAVVAQVDSDGTNSPPVERAMEKSLLEEISETLEQKKLQEEQTKHS